MNDSSEQDFTGLLAYQQTDSSENFVEQVIIKVNHRRQCRRRILMLAGAVATVTSSLLIGLSEATSWAAIVDFFNQSPMLLFFAVSIALLTGLLLRTEEN